MKFIQSIMIEKSNKFDLFVAPLILRNFGILDPEKAEELFSIGYDATKEKLKEIDVEKLFVLQER